MSRELYEMAWQHGEFKDSPDDDETMDWAAARIRELEAQLAAAQERNTVLQSEHLDHVNALHQQLTAAQDKLTTITRGDFDQFCAYCGWTTPKGSNAQWEELEKHVMGCPKHPLGEALRENAQLKEMLAQACNDLAAAQERNTKLQSEHLDHVYALHEQLTAANAEIERGLWDAINNPPEQEDTDELVIIDRLDDNYIIYPERKQEAADDHQ